MARTRIVATLGPATRTEDGIRDLADAGVDVFRLNLAHGTADEHRGTIAAIRKVAAARPIAILADLGGPKIRLTRPVKGAPGEVVEIDLPSGVQPGDPVLLADGIMTLEVVEGNRCRVLVGGDLPAGKGINLPSSRLDLPSLTAKDRADLEVVTAEGVDFIGVSFVRRASDLDAVRAAGVPIVAKIETAEAAGRLDEIVDAADAVMVARGDLGVEIPIERVPIIQKRLIALANRRARPVITATQLLRSMVESPLPTRAEATDVANAVLDGTDAVMLSEETAVGRHPVAAVRTMERIVKEAEVILEPRDPGPDPDDAVAHAACDLAERSGAKAIIVGTRAGTTARRVSRHRPRIPIIALTPDEAVYRRLSLLWGITAIRMPPDTDGAGILERFRDHVKGRVPAGSTVVVTAGIGRGATDLLHKATV